MTQIEIYNLMLKNRKEYTTKEISSKMRLTKQSTVRALKKLIDGGYVTREKVKQKNKYLYFASRGGEK